MQSKPAVLIVEDEPGIGLPFVREIAELHGGRITLRNADGAARWLCCRCRVAIRPRPEPVNAWFRGIVAT